MDSNSNPNNTNTDNSNNNSDESNKAGNSKGNKNGEKAEAVEPVGFGELFRFADGLDYALMAIGSLGAVVHGCSLPLFLRFFADLVNSFGSNAHDTDKMTQQVLKVHPFFPCPLFFFFFPLLLRHSVFRFCS